MSDDDLSCVVMVATCVVGAVALILAFRAPYALVPIGVAWAVAWALVRLVRGRQ
jgi:hypothetical protein